MSEMSGEVVPEAEPSDNGSTGKGNGRIDDAIARLERLDELPVDAHPEIFDEIHSGLRDALANAGRDEDPSLHQ
ncbi:MAG: hypothetical protein ACXWDA_05520 [Aeromicrobium sp.]